MTEGVASKRNMRINGLGTIAVPAPFERIESKPAFAMVALRRQLLDIRRKLKNKAKSLQGNSIHRRLMKQATVSTQFI
jgi:hypothetical protein